MDGHSRIRRSLKGGAVYFATVFTAGVVLGTMRALWLAPRIGEFAAVAAELPLILAASAWSGALTVRRFRVPATVVMRLTMGGFAFGLLLLAEAALAVTFRGMSLGEHLASYATAVGALGLAGQATFALLPLFARPRARLTA